MGRPADPRGESQFRLVHIVYCVSTLTPRPQTANWRDSKRPRRVFLAFLIAPADAHVQIILQCEFRRGVELQSARGTDHTSSAHIAYCTLHEHRAGCDDDGCSRIWTRKPIDYFRRCTAGGLWRPSNGVRDEGRIAAARTWYIIDERVEPKIQPRHITPFGRTYYIKQYNIVTWNEEIATSVTRFNCFQRFTNDNLLVLSPSVARAINAIKT